MAVSNIKLSRHQDIHILGKIELAWNTYNTGLPTFQTRLRIASSLDLSTKKDSIMQCLDITFVLLFCSHIEGADLPVFVQLVFAAV